MRKVKTLCVVLIAIMLVGCRKVNEEELVVENITDNKTEETGLGEEVADTAITDIEGNLDNYYHVVAELLNPNLGEVYWEQHKEEYTDYISEECYRDLVEYHNKNYSIEIGDYENELEYNIHEVRRYPLYFNESGEFIYINDEDSAFTHTYDEFVASLCADGSEDNNYPGFMMEFGDKNGVLLADDAATYTFHKTPEECIESLYEALTNDLYNMEKVEVIYNGEQILMVMKDLETKEEYGLVCELDDTNRISDINKYTEKTDSSPNIGNGVRKDNGDYWFDYAPSGTYNGWKPSESEVDNNNSEANTDNTNSEENINSEENSNNSGEENNTSSETNTNNTDNDISPVQQAFDADYYALYGRYPDRSKLNIGLDVSEDLIQKYNLRELEPELIKEAEKYVAYPRIYAASIIDDVLILNMENTIFEEVYEDEPQYIEDIIIVNLDGRFKSVFGPTTYDYKAEFN